MISGLLNADFDQLDGSTLPKYHVGARGSDLLYSNQTNELARLRINNARIGTKRLDTNRLRSRTRADSEIIIVFLFLMMVCVYSLTA